MVEQKGVDFFLIVILVLGLVILGYGIYSMITLKTMTKACENDKGCNFMKNMNAYGSLAIGLLLVLFSGGFYLYKNAKNLQWKKLKELTPSFVHESAEIWKQVNTAEALMSKDTKSTISKSIIMFVILGIIGLAILGFGIYALASKSEDCKTNKECNTIGDMVGYGAVAVGAVISFVSAGMVYKLKSNLS